MVKAGDEARKVGRGWVVKAFRVYGKKFRLGPQADGDSLEDFFFFFFKQESDKVRFAFHEIILVLVQCF